MSSAREAFEKHWSNAALAREAAEIVRRDLGTPKALISLGDDLDAIYGTGPTRPATAKELFRQVMMELRAQRRAMLEIPPGVGL